MYLYPRLSRGYSRDNKLEFQKKKKKKTPRRTLRARPFAKFGPRTYWEGLSLCIDSIRSLFVRFTFFCFRLVWFSCSPFRHYPFCVSLLSPYVAARPSPPSSTSPLPSTEKLFSKISPVTVAARVCCWQEHLTFAPFSLSPSTQAVGSILVLYEPPYLALVKSRNLNLPLYLSFPLFACSRSPLPHSQFKSFLS